MADLQHHIKCKKGDVARYVLTPGDPARVREIASYWDEAHEVAFNREFLTYTGKYHGIPISATSTGIGGPSASIAVEELANIGAEVFIRIGTCGGTHKKVKPGHLIVPLASMRSEGTSMEYLPPEFPAVANPQVYNALLQAAKEQKFQCHTGINRSHDAFYEHQDNLLKWAEFYKDKRMQNWDYPLVSSEMECTIVFLIPMLRGLQAGCVLVNVTPEPLSELAKNPDLIYKVDESSKKIGVNEAIETALRAVEILEGQRKAKK
ncbi:MAG: nucleoside phosphorylase [Candidatus Levyibacteriota bacterium]